MINSPSPSSEWGGATHGESALYFIYTHATGPSYAFSISLSLIAIIHISREKSRTIASRATIHTYTYRIIERMMLIGLVLFAVWTRTAVSEFRKFIC